MLRSLIFAMAVILGAGPACSDKNDNDKGKGGQGAQVVRKGSGKTCPTLNGAYQCGEGVSYQFTTGVNEEGKPVLVIGDQGVYISDGEIYDAQSSAGQVRYSVDCQDDSISIHAVVSAGGWAKGKISVLAPNKIKVESVGQAPDGQKISETEACEL